MEEMDKIDRDSLKIIHRFQRLHEQLNSQMEASQQGVNLLQNNWGKYVTYLTETPKLSPHDRMFSEAEAYVDFAAYKELLYDAVMYLITTLAQVKVLDEKWDLNEKRREQYLKNMETIEISSDED